MARGAAQTQIWKAMDQIPTMRYKDMSQFAFMPNKSSGGLTNAHKAHATSFKMTGEA